MEQEQADEQRERRHPVTRRLVRTAAITSGLSVCIATGVGGGAAYWSWKNNRIPGFVLHAADQLPPELPQANESLVCAADTQPCTIHNAVAVYGERPQRQVGLGDIKPGIQQALVDAEDNRFWQSPGCDAKAIMRASGTDLLTKIKVLLHLRKVSVREGASTIDRQVISNAFEPPTDNDLQYNTQPVIRFAYQHDPDQKYHSYTRQVWECSAALKLDETYSKKWILQKYFNSVYFGRSTYGIEAAAEAYYGVPASKLTLQQGISLVARVRAPSYMDMRYSGPHDPRYSQVVTCPSPVSLPSQEMPRYQCDNTWLTQNYNRVVIAMRHAGDLSSAQLASLDLKTHPLTPLPYHEPTNAGSTDVHNADRLGARHFLDYVRLQLAHDGISPTRLATGGLTVYTTLNTKDQLAMYRAITDNPHLRGSGLDAAGIALEPDGSIVAEVGSQNFNTIQTNIAIDGRLKAGSSLKWGLLAEQLADGDSIYDPVTLPRSVTIPIPGSQPWVIDSEQGCSRLGETAPCSQMPDGQPIERQDAIAMSSNTYAAESIIQEGVSRVAAPMAAFGMRLQPAKETPSMILGAAHEGLAPVDLAVGMNGILQNGGRAVFYGNTPYSAISRVVDSTGRTIYHRPAARWTRVFATSVSQGVAEALKEVLDKPYGTAYHAIDSPAGPDSVAGKTGTAVYGNTSANSDLWFSGAVRDTNAALSRSFSFWLGHAAASAPITNGLTSWNAAEVAGRYVHDRPHTNRPADIAAEPVG